VWYKVGIVKIANPDLGVIVADRSLSQGQGIPRRNAMNGVGDYAREHEERTREYHMERIRAFLSEEGRMPSEAGLWLSVGYFYEGSGRNYLNTERPFTEEEWKRLLVETGRSLEDEHYFTATS